jgi:hypothetical protein
MEQIVAAVQRLWCKYVYGLMRALSTNLTQPRHLWYTVSMRNEMQDLVRAAQRQPLYYYERYYPYARIPGSLLT